MENIAVSNLNPSSVVDDENRFWVYFIIIVIVSVTIYFLFFKKSEGFSGLLNLNPLPTLSQIPKDAKNVKVENSDKSGKIIQKIS